MLSDHEQRVRSLERWKYSLPIAVLLALGSLGTTIAEFMSHR